MTPTTTDQPASIVARAARIRTIVDGEIDYRRPDYRFEVVVDGDRITLELFHRRPDVVTGRIGWGGGGPRPIAADSTVSTVVRAAVAAALAYEEHEVREYFRFRGKRVFGPHLDVEALVEVADRLDVR